MIRSNFHTHTCYCDGADTPSQLAEQALALGFTVLGFSGHANSPVEDYAMSPAGQLRYREEIQALKPRYAGRLRLLCGLECDLFAPVAAGWDYVIASVHYVEKDGLLLPVDLSAAASRENVTRHYGGDLAAYARDYFDHVCRAVEKHRPALIGHLDLLMKYAEACGWEETPAYLAAAEDCIARLAPLGIPFEINTGAMARGCRTVPYPSPRLLRLLHAHGGEIAISSDCHRREALNYAFREAAALALDCGFRTHVSVRNGPWSAVSGFTDHCPLVSDS